MRTAPVFSVMAAGLVLAVGSMVHVPRHHTIAAPPEEMLHGCTVVVTHVYDYHPSTEMCSPID